MQNKQIKYVPTLLTHEVFKFQYTIFQYPLIVRVPKHLYWYIYIDKNNVGCFPSTSFGGLIHLEEITKLHA